mgnify:FL=1
MNLTKLLKRGNNSFVVALLLGGYYRCRYFFKICRLNRLKGYCGLNQGEKILKKLE